MGDMRAFYEALKAFYGQSHQIQAPLRSSDGSTLLTAKEAIPQRWSEHFEGFYGDRHTVQESSLAKIPQVDVKLELDGPPTREEIRKATMQQNFGTLFPHCSPSSSVSCSVKQKRICQTTSTSVSKQTAVSLTFDVFSNARKPSRNS